MSRIGLALLALSHILMRRREGKGRGRGESETSRIEELFSYCLVSWYGEGKAKKGLK